VTEVFTVDNKVKRFQMSIRAGKGKFFLFNVSIHCTGRPCVLHVTCLPHYKKHIYSSLSRITGCLAR